MDEIESIMIALQLQGKQLIELQSRISVLERALRMHVNDLETAHKV